MSMSFTESFSRYAKERGISALSFYILQTERSGVSVFQGTADAFSSSDVTQVFIEANVNGKRGSAFTEDFGEKRFAELTDMLLQSAVLSDAPFRELELKPLGSVRKAEQADLSRGADRLLAIERETLALDPRVSSVALHLSYINRSVTLANSELASMTDSYGAASFASRVAARADGQTQTCSERVLSESEFEITPYALETARRAIGLLSAQPCESGRYPIVFEAPVFGRIFETYMPAFFGSRVSGGTSLLAGKIGERIASPQISLRENPSALVLRSFDDEGAATRQKSIIENGELKCYLHRAGKESAGNGFRPSYRAAAAEGYTNIELSMSQPPEGTLSELCAQVQNGLLIHECDGIFAGANVTSGAFSLISKGWLIENGKITRPVSRITVGGNFFDLLQNITACANDARIIGDAGSGTLKTPSVLVRELAVSGK